MEARPGNSPQKKPVAPPRDRRLPLSYVEFQLPQPLDICAHPVRFLTAGENIYQTDVKCPPLFLDPELRCVMVGDSLYFIGEGLIRRVKRAKAAKS
jgi:hypothetical protein